MVYCSYRLNEPLIVQIFRDMVVFKQVLYLRVCHMQVLSPVVGQVDLLMAESSVMVN